MSARSLPRIALIWSQFSAYHVDRCEAVARRLDGQAEVLAIEVATASATYAWEQSGKIDGATKITLFAGQDFESVPMRKRFWAQFKLLRRCKVVFVGLSYGQIDVIILTWLLRLFGVKFIAMGDSKFDDFQRSAGFELFKSLLLAPYSAAIVAAQRQMAYFRFLGFRRRVVLPGYDGVSVDRIRKQANCPPAPDGEPFAKRNFIFVGRFVPKKNLQELIAGFAAYVALAGRAARRLILVGAGPQEAMLKQRVAELGLTGMIDFTGFLGAEAVSQQLARSLALMLVSTEEQWGLVVNEALACGLPVVSSVAVGSRDVLVRNLVNGFIIEQGSIDGMVQAMMALSHDEQLWRSMVAASHEKAWLGDAERFADAVQLTLDPQAEPAGTMLKALRKAIGDDRQGDGG